LKGVAQRFLNVITFLTVIIELGTIAIAGYNNQFDSDVRAIIGATALVGHGFVALANYVFFGKLTLWHRFDEQD